MFLIQTGFLYMYNKNTVCIKKVTNNATLGEKPQGTKIRTGLKVSQNKQTSSNK